MQQAAPVEETTPRSERAWVNAANMRGRLPRRVGALAGLVGSVAIIAVITAVIVATGNGLFTAPRVIASVVFGANVSGVLPVIVGTIIHLFTGTALGFIFAAIMPPIYRTMWMVAGLIYGMLAFAVSTMVVLPLITQMATNTADNVFVLLIAHMVYGFILGIAGSTYGLWWKLPKSVSRED